MFLGYARIFPDCLKERLASLSRRALSRQDVREWHEFPIKKAGFIFVLGDGSSVEIDPCEDAAGSRVGQHFGLHLPVRIGCGIASDRASGGRSVGAQFEFAREEVLHPIGIPYDHHQINRLTAKVQSPASSRDRDRGGGTPGSSFGATGRHTFSMTPSKTNCNFHHGRDYGDTL